MAEMKRLMARFPYIIAWCQLLETKQSFLQATLLKAHKENAPERSVYRQFDGKWVTIDDVNPANKKKVEMFLDVS